MKQYVLIIGFSAVILVTVAGVVAKRSSFLGLVLASLPLFLRGGFGFWPSLGAACFATAAAHFGRLKIWGFWVFAYSFAHHPAQRSSETGQKPRFCPLPSTINIFRIVNG